MRLLADENCGTTLLSALAAAGHDVVAVVRQRPSIDDDAVFALALEQHRVLLTHDRDFGRLAEQASARPPAIVLMRLRGIGAAARARIVTQALGDLSDSIDGHFVVIGPANVRRRSYKRDTE